MLLAPPEDGSGVGDVFLFFHKKMQLVSDAGKKLSIPVYKQV